MANMYLRKRHLAGNLNSGCGYHITTVLQLWLCFCGAETPQPRELIQQVWMPPGPTKWMHSNIQAFFMHWIWPEYKKTLHHWRTTVLDNNLLVSNERILWVGNVSMEFSKSHMPKSDLENPILTFPIPQYSHCWKLQIRCRYEGKTREIALKMTMFFMFTLCKVVRKTLTQDESTVFFIVLIYPSW